MPYLQRQPLATLLRSLLVFRLCRVPLIVKNARPLLAGLQRLPLLGPPLAHALIRRTFFAQFVGGESEAELAPLVAALAREGVGSILDYAAEADEAAVGEPLAQHAAAEAHAHACLRLCQQGVAAAAHTGGFAAVKVTGIADPEVLKHVTARMHEHRRAFRALLPGGGGGSEDAPLYLTAQLTREAFLAALAARSPGAPPGAAARLWALCDVRGQGRLDYLAFCDAARLLGFGQAHLAQAAAEACGLATPEEALALLLGTPRPTAAASHTPGSLTPAQRSAWNSALGRLGQLCQTAHALGVSLMVDAEQTYLQGAIDLAVVTMQRAHNPPCGGANAAAAAPGEGAGEGAALLPEERHALALCARVKEGGAREPVPAASAPLESTPPLAPPNSPPPIIPVFNTYQSYLRDTPSRLALALLRAEREGWALGVKLVRGAYMSQERARAQELGYHDPIWPSIDGTHASYAACVEQLLTAAGAQRAAFMVASHNTQSCLSAAARVQGGARAEGAGAEAGPARLRAARCVGGVSFGQLLGMSDALTFSLAARGLAAFKYMPYGPVAEVVPYLLRRGEENSDLLTSNVGAEIAELQGELLARVLGRKA